jgi:glucose/arabinose dehydrogenase
MVPVLALVTILVTACSSTTASPSTTVTSTATPASPTASSSTAAAPLAACPATEHFAALPVLARVALADDLATASDGTLWVSNPNGGYIVHVAADGTVLQRIDDAHTPEGMVALSDGRLLLAEQSTDRVVVLHPPSTTATTFVQLNAVAGVAGVDGLGVDLASQRLLVPDSAQGAMESVSLAGGQVTHLATGLGRAVGAAVSPDGGYVVTAEATAGLLRVPQNGGSATQIANIAQADDVVADGQLLYVTALTAHQVIAVDPRTGATRVLVTGVAEPQGLAVLDAHRIAVSDSATGIVAVATVC